jgi:hypothetical protein
LYTLTSDSSSKDQFRYIAQVSSNESSSLGGLDYPDVTLKYYPNTSLAGIIDLANVFNRYLAWDENSMAWSTNPTSPLSSQDQSTVQNFTVSFGEEFADSPSSSLQTITGSIVETIQIFQGKVDIESGDYNFNTASLKSNNNNIFSDMPDVIYDNTEYNFLQECPKAGTKDTQTLTLLSQSNYIINVYSEAADHYTGSSLLTITGSTADENISIVGVGPLNILNSGVANRGVITGSSAAWITFSQTDPVVYKPINIMLPKHSHYPCNNVNRTESPVPSSRETITEYVRFIWQNNYGMWDFYNVYNTLQQVNVVDRQSYTQPQPTYDLTTSPFDINNRGEKQYSSILTERFAITTDYVSQKTSDWLTQLFDSNNVYIDIPQEQDGEVLPHLRKEYGTDIRAIVINDVNYRWQETRNRNKAFQYTINWSFANKSFVY